MTSSLISWVFLLVIPFIYYILWRDVMWRKTTVDNSVWKSTTKSFTFTIVEKFTKCRFTLLEQDSQCDINNVWRQSSSLIFEHCFSSIRTIYTGSNSTTFSESIKTCEKSFCDLLPWPVASPVPIGRVVTKIICRDRHAVFVPLF